MIKVVAFEGKQKLANKWEEDPYVVLEIPNPDIPVCVVRKEKEEGRKRTLHRNMLLPFGTLNSSLEEPFIRKPPVPAPRRRTKHVDSKHKENVATPDPESERNDSADDELLSRRVTKMSSQ
jgi:hypothetical protein